MTELPPTSGLSGHEMLSYEILEMEASAWRAAWAAGYLSDAGLPIPDRLRTNQKRTLLGGFQGGYKPEDLAETCQFFLSGEHNRYFGHLGIRSMDVDEVLRWLKRGAEQRAERQSRQRLRDPSKEPHAWISLAAAAILTGSPEVRASTWATYSALCILAGERGGDEYDSTFAEIAKVANLSTRSVRRAMELLRGLRLIAFRAKAFRPTRIRMLSVNEA